jgi:hypothetical protein
MPFNTNVQRVLLNRVVDKKNIQWNKSQKMDYKDQQKSICQKYNSNYVSAPDNMLVGISLNVKQNVQPINGLRHPTTNDTTGWYIWGGEQYSEDEIFFTPLHVKHLVDWYPQIIKYLGLPPGWRFLIDSDGYEDVWEDLSLLDIE